MRNGTGGSDPPSSLAGASGGGGPWPSSDRAGHDRTDAGGAPKASGARGLYERARVPVRRQKSKRGSYLSRSSLFLILGSGLIDHIQKMTVAAMRMADMKMRGAIVTGVETAPVLELAEHIRDPVALIVKCAVVRDRDFAVGLGRDAEGDALCDQGSSKLVGIDAPLAEHRPGLGHQRGAPIRRGTVIYYRQAGAPPNQRAPSRLKVGWPRTKTKPVLLLRPSNRRGHRKSHCLSRRQRFPWFLAAAPQA